MKWLRKTSTTVIAQGKEGAFYLENRSGHWYARYIAKEKAFNLPPKRLLKDIKKMCEENFYWEDELNDKKESQRTNNKG